MDRPGTTDPGNSASAPIEQPAVPAIEQAAVPAIEQEEHELACLWMRFAAARGPQRLGAAHWAMDGWLWLHGDPRPPFPVILVEFNADGVGVVLGVEHPVQPGQQGDLTTQAHGAGCQHRAVRCRRRQSYSPTTTLHYAAFGFQVPQSAPP
jgi:hypothetical protein